ncbi:MAG: hypothetical protein OXB84_00425 [Halobacteriovoraceae bacterium]|nr:hypothetical protein [Halobacteriovoraceae bacterium]
MKSFMAFLKDESGQTTVEYVLLLVVAAFLVFKFKDMAHRGISDLTEGSNGVFGKAQGFLDNIK